jgi:hypothetical protein
MRFIQIELEPKEIHIQRGGQSGRYINIDRKK